MNKLKYIVLLAMSFTMYGQGYLHQDGQSIVNGDGDNVLLRGLGLGGWMVQEGYMLQTSDFAGPQHEIRKKIADLIGETNTEAFYQAYRDNGITKRDIDSLKAWGFNSVRLPMHYNLYTLPIEDEPVAGENTWLDEGFDRTDQLLQWCADNEIYLILDMHATPGGQGKDANISDYDDTKPSLWESDANRSKMIALWKELADRYKDSPWIGGYDLINEPNWNFTGTNQNGCDEGSNAPLRSLMVAVTEAIREVDTNHMIIIEGNCWGNNYNGIFPLWDDNMALSFHKYWNANTTGAIQGILNLRTDHNVPIWLGETGENSNVWFRDAITLVEANNIGWAWWPMKKIGSIAGPAAVSITPEYQQLLNYWTNGGTAPTPEFATAALMQIAENYKMQNVTTKPDVIDAMFRQIGTTETVKYKTHALPGKVYATEYDLGPNEFAYLDHDIATYHTDTSVYTAWNQGWSMRNDGVDIQAATDAVNNGFQVGFVESGEWLLYTIESDELTAYDIDIRYSGSGSLHLEDVNGRISEKITLTGTGGFNNWSTVTLTDVLLQAGTNKIKVYFDAGGSNLNYLDFKNPRPSSEADFKIVDAATNVLGDKINVVFNKELATAIDFSASSLTLKVNGAAVAVSEIAMTPSVPNSFSIKPAIAINAADVVTLTYAGNNIMALDATTQPVFNDKPVTNRMGTILAISGLIEAEAFYENNGLTLENCSDAGAGQNIAYTDAGDSLEYLVNIANAGNYRIEYRTAGLNQTGEVKLQLTGDNGTQNIQTVSLASTGGWQTWQTTTAEAQLPAGRYFLKVLITAPGFNMNWIKFSYLEPDDDNDGIGNTTDLCPGTPAGDVVDFNGCTLFSLPAANFTVLATGESCRTSNNGSITITASANHNYTATLTATGYNENTAFTSSASFNNLQAGDYQLCFTLADVPSYQQCFDIVIEEPVDLAVLSRVSEKDYSLELDLFGGNRYTISLNDETYITSANTIRLSLKPGENNITVKTDKDCQGTFAKKIMMNDAIMVHPNPVTGSMVFITLPAIQDGKATVEIYSVLGNRVLSSDYITQDRTFGIDMSALASGVYIVKVATGTTAYNTKIVKE
jgi:endoglucanase